MNTIKGTNGFTFEFKSGLFGLASGNSRYSNHMAPVRNCEITNEYSTWNVRGRPVKSPRGTRHDYNQGGQGIVAFP